MRQTRNRVGAPFPREQRRQSQASESTTSPGQKLAARTDQLYMRRPLTPTRGRIAIAVQPRCSLLGTPLLPHALILIDVQEFVTAEEHVTEVHQALAIPWVAKHRHRLAELSC